MSATNKAADISKNINLYLLEATHKKIVFSARRQSLMSLSKTATHTTFQINFKY